MLNLVLSLLSNASALSCEHGLIASKPNVWASSAEELPANLRGFFEFAGVGLEQVSVSLIDADGTAVELSVERPYSQNQVMLWEASNLMQGSYTIQVDVGQNWIDEFALEIGTELDTNAPPAPTLLQTKREVGADEWGTWDYLNIQLSPASEPVYYRIESSADESFSASKTVYKANWTSIGFGHCDSTHSSEELDQISHLRITAIDLGGNESVATTFEVDTSTEERIGTESESSSKIGCSSLGHTPKLSLAFLCLMGLLILRRGDDDLRH